MVGYLSGIWVDVGPCYDDWLVVGGISDGSCVAVIVSILVNVSSHLSLFV